MHCEIIGQFDNRNLLEGMDFDMGGAFVKTKTGNKYVHPWEWILKDPKTGLFETMTDEEYQNQYVTNKQTNMVDVTRELTFGEKAVGITFNPGGNPLVNAIKEKAAEYIDVLYQQRELTTNGEIKRMLSVAIAEAQTSQMWAVKAVTWQY